MPLVVVNDGREIPLADFLEDRFHLTRTEACLVGQLVQGTSLKSSAEALGVKYETARTYLKATFQKTGTHRQAELVLRVLHAMGDPNLPAVPAAIAAQELAHDRLERNRHPHLGGYAEQKRYAQLRRRGSP